MSCRIRFRHVKKRVATGRAGLCGDTYLNVSEIDSRDGVQQRTELISRVTLGVTRVRNSALVIAGCKSLVVASNHIPNDPDEILSCTPEGYLIIIAPIVSKML